jgi:putative Holliday junction resolvase
MIFSDKDQLNQALPLKGRLIALDVGSKRIGLAICDETRFIATPKLVLHRMSNEKDFAKIKEIIDENKVVGIVVGLPLNMDESESEMSKFVRKFSDNLDNFFENKLPILLFDERLSSFEAREIARSKLSRKKEFCDDIAAAVILESFLQSVIFNNHRS